MTRQFLLLFFLLVNVFSKAQENEHPLMAKGYLGYSTYTPQLKGKGFEAVGLWQGVEANFEGMTFSYHNGSQREIGADSTIGNPNSSIFKIGFRMGPSNWNLGNISFFSIGIKPYVQISGAYAQSSTKILNDEVASAGLVFSPGIQLNASHFYLSASYDAGFYLNTAFFGGNRSLNLARGYLGGTTITFGFENSFDLLAPEAFSLKGYNIEKRTKNDDKGVKYDYTRGAYYREIVTTTTTKYTPGERALALVRPFWGVGPSYSFSSLGKRQAPTAMQGANIGFRFWYLMIDGFYEFGSMGLKGEVGRKEILTTYPQLRNYDFSSQVQATQYGGRIGFNLSKFIALKVNFEQSDESRGISALKVPFVRLNAFYTMGVTTFSGNPEYTYNNASSRLVDYQQKKNITSTPDNNPDFLIGDVVFNGFGGSLEIGSTFFNATWYKYPGATIANHMQFTLGTNIPLGRLFHASRLRLTI